MQLSHLAAYAVALYFLLQILKDHPTGSTMRLAWLMMTWSAVLSIVRHGFELTSGVAGWTVTMPTTLVSLRQIPIVLALVFLTAGLVAMWSSFASIGMGLRFRWTDLIWVAVILAMVPFVISSRENMADARSAYPLIRGLQSLSPILLAVPALLAVALHRIRQEMGGGQLATALRLLVAFLVLRLVALLVGTSGLRSDFPWLAALTQAGGWAAPWLFTLAAVQRWRLTISANELERRYESDPHREIAGLFNRRADVHADVDDPPPAPVAG